MLLSLRVNAPAKLEETGVIPLRGIGYDGSKQVNQPFVLLWMIKTDYNGARHFSTPEEWSR